MRLLVNIDPKTALLAGKTLAGRRVIEFDPAELTPEERAALVALTEANADATVDLKARNYNPISEMIEPTLADLRRVLAIQVARDAEAEAKEQAEDVKMLAADPHGREWLELAWVKNKPGRWVVANNGGRAKRPEFAAVVTQAQAEADRRNVELDLKDAEAERRKAEKAAADKALKDAELQWLATWVRAYGSVTARMRLEDGFDTWAIQAANDYANLAAARVTAGFELTPSTPPKGMRVKERGEREYPTAAELTVFRAVRAAIEKEPEPGMADVEVEIMYVTYHEFDEDGAYGDDIHQRPELRIGVSVAGHDVDVYYRLDDLPAETPSETVTLPGLATGELPPEQFAINQQLAEAAAAVVDGGVVSRVAAARLANYLAEHMS